MAERSPLHVVTEQAGARFLEIAGWEIPALFSTVNQEYQAACESVALFDQSAHGKIEVSGPGAADYLQNISSNDICSLKPGTGCETFLLTHKARVIAHGYIYRGEDALWFDLMPGLSEKVFAHLDHYLIGYDAELADYTQEYAQLHLAGPGAAELLKRACGVEVTELGHLHHLAHSAGDKQLIIRRHNPLGVPGFDLLMPNAQAEEVWGQFQSGGAVPAGWETSEILRIEAGTPAQGQDMDENTFAPDVGRTPQAISYNKGCYLGQEPVVMARDRGQVNRTLMGLNLPDGVVPPGSTLHRESKEIGRVTSSAHSPRLGSALALAYVRRGHQEPGTTVEVETEDGRHPAEVVPLPFLQR